MPAGSFDGRYEHNGVAKEFDQYLLEVFTRPVAATLQVLGHNGIGDALGIPNSRNILHQSPYYGARHVNVDQLRIDIEPFREKVE